LLKNLTNSRATTPIAALLILLGVLSLIASGTTMVVQFYHFIASGHSVTVPVESIELSIEPNTPYGIYHRVTGAHVTENRPAFELPDTLTISVIDTSSNEEIELETVNWSMQSGFFGLRTKRQAIRKFTAPEGTDSVTLQVSGLDAETVFYLGRTHHVYNENEFPFYLAWAIGSLLLIIISATLILRRIVMMTPELTIRHEQ